jgi:hypothetical protein
VPPPIFLLVFGASRPGSGNIVLVQQQVELLARIYDNDQMKEDEIDMACSTHGREVYTRFM